MKKFGPFFNHFVRHRMSYNRGHNNGRYYGSRDGGGGPDRHDRRPHHHNKPYDNRRGGYHDNRRGGFHGERRGGFHDNRRGGYHDKPISDEVKLKVGMLFDKSYIFTGTEGFSLPDHKTWFTHPPYKVPTHNFIIVFNLINIIGIKWI